MASRVLFELFFFLLPFGMFGLYRIAITEAEEEGRKPWPIRWLFGAGMVLAIGFWIVFIILDHRGGRDECIRPSRLENGVLIPQETYPCERDLTKIGRPQSDDPGGVADGVGEVHPAGPEE